MQRKQERFCVFQRFWSLVLITIVSISLISKCPASLDGKAEQEDSCAGAANCNSHGENTWQDEDDRGDGILFLGTVEVAIYWFAAQDRPNALKLPAAHVYQREA